MSELVRFIPEGQNQDSIEIDYPLGPVVERLAQIFPPEKVWEMYSSTPGEIRGRVIFPYCRVDADILDATDHVYILEHYQLTPEEFAEKYQLISSLALRTLAWVEVGFQGLENLARSYASRNWTTFVGHSLNDEERAQAILTSGKEMYKKRLGQIASLRKNHGIVNDCFSQYGTEYLLETLYQD